MDIEIVFAKHCVLSSNTRHWTTFETRYTLNIFIYLLKSC